MSHVIKHDGVFHLWGHSWEIEEENLWPQLSEIFEAMAAFRAELVRFAANGEISAALAAFSAARAPRASRVQQEALTQARIYHMSGPLAVARDFGMRALGPKRLLGRYDWLYGA